MPPQILTDFVKVYPNKSKLYVYKNLKITKPPNNKKSSSFKLDSSQTDDSITDTTDISNIRRARTTIADLVQCNKFDLFCTFTFNPKKVDRTNPDECKRVMSQWLHNQQKKQITKISYLIVPEFHKDGKALHFHALFKNYQGKLIFSGHKINGRKSFNFESYKSGFSSAVKIDNSDKVSSYIRKYITKDMPKFKGSKRYWRTYDLKQPRLYKNTSLHLNPFLKAQLIFENEYFTIYELPTTLHHTNHHYKEEIWQPQNEHQSLTILKTYMSSPLHSPTLIQKKLGST